MPTSVPNSAASTVTKGNVSINSSFATQSADEKPPKSKELQDCQSQYGLVWIMYIHYAHQAHDLKAFQAIFLRAQKDHWMPQEVYKAVGV